METQKSGTKINVDWLNRKDLENRTLKTYIEIIDDYTIKCNICRALIDVRSGGYAAITKHIGSQKHNTQMNLKYDLLAGKKIAVLILETVFRV